MIISLARQARSEDQLHWKAKITFTDIEIDWFKYSKLCWIWKQTSESGEWQRFASNPEDIY